MQTQFMLIRSLYLASQYEAKQTPIRHSIHCCC